MNEFSTIVGMILLGLTWLALRGMADGTDGAHDRSRTRIRR